MAELSDLYDAVILEVLAIRPGELRESVEILDPTEMPATAADGAFSVDMALSNTDKYRDNPDGFARIDAATTIRVLYQMNPKVQTKTLRRIIRDEQNIIETLMTTTREPLTATRVSYRNSLKTRMPKREWMMLEVVFSIEFDLSFTEVQEMPV